MTHASDVVLIRDTSSRKVRRRETILDPLNNKNGKIIDCVKGEEEDTWRVSIVGTINGIIKGTLTDFRCGNERRR